MNKVFKIVFSRVKGMFVVGSEHISSHGKKNVKAAIAAVAMMVGAMGIAGNAVAATYDFQDTDQITNQTTATNLQGKFKDYNEIKQVGTKSIFSPIENIILDGELTDGSKSSIKFLGKDQLNSESSSQTSFDLHFNNFDELTFASENKKVYSVSIE